MIEMVEGFLACLGAALFLGLMLAEVKSIISRLASRLDDKDSGASEGDHTHFLVDGDSASQSSMPIHQAK